MAAERLLHLHDPRGDRDDPRLDRRHRRAYALSLIPGAAEASRGEGATLQATGLDHVALNVRRDGGEETCFLGSGHDFTRTRFRG